MEMSRPWVVVKLDDETREKVAEALREVFSVSVNADHVPTWDEAAEAVMEALRDQDAP